MNSTTIKAHPEKPLTDQNLIRRAVDGDSVAREHLAVACLPRVRRLVGFSCSDRNNLDDVVQIAMVSIFRDLAGLRSTERFTAWVDTVVYNVVRSHGRKRVRWNALFTTVETPPPSSQRVTPEDEQIGEELFNRLAEHLERINPRKRSAAVMSTFFGYVDSEVAEIMGCSVETAKKRIQHGRRELLERMQKDPECRDLLKEATR